MAKDFLGKGWAFPVALDDGSLVYTSEEARVQDSVLVILGTARGERVMRPTFGSRLHELVFAPVNSHTRSLLSRYVIDALVAWEPRVEVIRVEVSDEEAVHGKLLVNIEYRVRATNSVFNLVYPFYLQEGESGGS